MRRRPPLQTTFSAYAGVRGQIWEIAQNCFSHASGTGGTVNKWKFNCFVTDKAVSSSRYDERFILNWDGGKKQVLLIPVDYISGGEANDFYSNPAVLLPDYWGRAIAALDGQLKKNPYYAPDGGGFGVAMNSANFRTRDQLHLHICTVEKDKIDAINSAQPVADNFRPMQFKRGGHIWWIRKLAANENVWDKTFLNGGGRANTDDKANVSIAVIQDTHSNYWLLYNQRGNPISETGAGAETLLQDQCNGAKDPA